MDLPWNLTKAAAIAPALEAVAVGYGMHVALTGGTLFKKGARKDADYVFYNIRKAKPDVDRFLAHLDAIGVTILSDHGFVVKAATQEGLPVDLLFPERPVKASDGLGGYR